MNFLHTLVGVDHVNLAGYAPDQILVLGVEFSQILARDAFVTSLPPGLNVLPRQVESFRKENVNVWAP